MGGPRFQVNIGTMMIGVAWIAAIALVCTRYRGFALPIIVFQGGRLIALKHAETRHQAKYHEWPPERRKAEEDTAGRFAVGASVLMLIIFAAWRVLH